jgi:hypothetical protein
MDELTDRRGEAARQLDVGISGVDDLDAVAGVETEVREAFASAGVDGKWTVALRRRNGVGGWTVGLVGCRDGGRVRARLKIELTDSLRAAMTDLFAHSGAAQPRTTSDRVVA